MYREREILSPIKLVRNVDQRLVYETPVTPYEL